MLGQPGLPGGGFAYSLGAVGNVGKPSLAVPLPTLPQGRNPVRSFIPVARIADMLLNPGQQFDYNGQRLTYPDIKLVYWAGGNPFHHHQDLNRLRRAFARPDTLVVHDSVWTASARHADFVLPATITLEREDIGAAGNDALMIAMHAIIEPYGQARDDYAIFAGLAERLGVAEAFTEGRSASDWLRVMYDRTRDAVRALGEPAPDFDAFWEQGELALPTDPGSFRALQALRAGSPLPTPSGKMELYSETIAAFGYAGLPRTPGLAAPRGSRVRPAAPDLQPAGDAPAQPARFRRRKPGRQAAWLRAGRACNPNDAAARGITEGDLVRLFNPRGACLAVAVLSPDVRPGVAQICTGAWYDPDDPAGDEPLCVHGNPNVLTRDVGTSALAQGCTGQLTCVEIERFTGNQPPIRAYDPPEMVQRALR